MRLRINRWWCVWIALGLSSISAAQPAAGPSGASPADAFLDSLINVPYASWASRLEHEPAALHKDLLDASKRHGIAAFGRGELPLAEAFFGLQLRLAEESGNSLEIARGLYNSVLVPLRQGRWENAAPILQRCIQLSEEAHDLQGLANALNSTMNLQRRRGDLDSAKTAGLRALSLYQEIGNRTGQAQVWNNLGNLYLTMGDLTAALDCFRQCLLLSEQLGNQQGIAFAAHNMARVYSQQRNYSLARDLLLKALRIRERSGNKSEVAATLMNLGVVELELGNEQSSEQATRRAVALAEETRNLPQLGSALANLGMLEKRRGHYRAAVEYVRQGLDVCAKTSDRGVRALLLLQLADLRRAQGELPQALADIQNVLQEVESLHRQEDAADAYATAGMIYLALNRKEEARKALLQAIRNVELLRQEVTGTQLERERFFEDKAALYRAMVKLEADAGRTGEALRYAERARGRVLLDVLSRGREDISKAMTPEERAEERRLKSRVAVLNQRLLEERAREQPSPNATAVDGQLAQARRAYSAFRSALYVSHPELRVWRGESEPLTTAQFGALIHDRRAALLEYVVLEDQLLLFVITPGAAPETPVVKLYRTAVRAAELSAKVNRFRNAIAAHELGFRPLASELYKLLLTPAEAQLRSAKTLAIVPDGTLWHLPFQALQCDARRYLLERQELFYAPSLTVLAGMDEAGPNYPKRAMSILALGDPALPTPAPVRMVPVLREGPADPLPEAAREVAMLGRLYSGSGSLVLTGSKAQEEQFKSEAGRYDIVHIATHGILDNRDPMYSRLLLAKGSGNQDGLLEAWEIMDLNLKADTVVLSACETGRGRVGDGEGLIGMAWALFVAGSRTTVASQWSVESTSTTRLMIDFHRNLKERLTTARPGLTKAGSLRLGALPLLRTEQYRHPFYWAGFVMIGQGF